MPQKDDYLQRVLEQMATTIASIMGLKQAGKEQQALQEIQQAYQQQLASSSQLIQRLSAEDLIAMLSSAQVIDSARAYFLAELLWLEAELLPDGREVQQEKALNLYLAAYLNDVSLRDHLILRLDEVIPQNLSFLRQQTLSRLADYFFDRGYFDKTEDALFLALEQADGAVRFNQARRIYRELLALPDDVLQAGGLPREEVLEGQAQLAQFEGS